MHCHCRGPCVCYHACLGPVLDPCSTPARVVPAQFITYEGVGDFSYASADLILERDEAAYMTDYVLKSIFFVLMSYAGMWISAAAAPARVALAVISILVVSVRVTRPPSGGGSLPHSPVHTASPHRLHRHLAHSLSLHQHLA
jgi:hypothetical protein